MDKFESCLKDLLKEHLVEVTFTKVNGNLRIMNCTLRPDYIVEDTKSPSIEFTPGYDYPDIELVEPKLSSRKKTEGVLSVWDIDNSGWRSFRLDSVETYKVIRMRNED